MLRVAAALLFVATTCWAQARLADPPGLVPSRSPCGAVDPSTGALYVMGGRDDHVLDVWRLENGIWQRVAAGPFLGVVSSIAFDPVRQRLVACATNEAGATSLQELDGTTWTATAATPATPVLAGSTLLWHPVQARMLVWIPPIWWPPVQTSTHTLWAWNGVALTQLSMAGLTFFSVPGARIGYDSARDRLVVPQSPYSLPWVHEWDGNTWTTVVAPGGTGSGASGGSQVFTDPFTGRAVFGSTSSPQTSMAWTGQAFVNAPLTGAPNRAGPVLVGNAVRQVIQIVGGSAPYYVPHSDCWEFAGANWQQVTPDAGDPQIANVDMVGVGVRRVLMFGTTNGAVNVAQTAIWDDGTWTVLQPAHSPPMRTNFALAGDPATGRAFLFGGTSSAGLLADFWMWDGSDWQQLPGGPSGRTDAGLCFRSDAQRVVLYGGLDSVGGANYETWEWDGASWLLRSATWPPHVGPARLAWHAQRQRTVLATFGLQGIEMWEWDGTNWASTNPPSRPSIVQGSLLATYDPVRETVLVVDPVGTGGSPMPLGNMYEWDNGTWHSFAPEARLRGSWFSIAGVIGTGLVVANGSGRVTLTLEHDFPAVVSPFGSACPDPSRVASANQPWLGRTYTVRYPCDPGTLCVFASGFSNVQWSGLPLPLDLGVLGLPSCSLYVAADLVDLRVPSGGSASLAIVLPATPALAGTHLYHQAAALTSGFSAVSQGLEIVTGSLW